MHLTIKERPLMPNNSVLNLNRIPIRPREDPIARPKRLLSSKEPRDAIERKENIGPSPDFSLFDAVEETNYQTYPSDIVKSILKDLRYMNIFRPYTNRKKINLKPSEKKTLFLDLDETLIHTSFSGKFDVALAGNPLICFSIRPFVIEFLEYASRAYELILFTAAEKSYADRVIKYIDPSNKYFSHRLYRGSCIGTPEGYIKDLSLVMTHRKPQDIIIVDNSIISFAYQLNNGIPIMSWFGDKSDTELRKLIYLLKILEKAEDVRVPIKYAFNLSRFL